MTAACAAIKGGYQRVKDKNEAPLVWRGAMGFPPAWTGLHGGFCLDVGEISSMLESMQHGNLKREPWTSERRYAFVHPDRGGAWAF